MPHRIRRELNEQAKHILITSRLQEVSDPAATVHQPDEDYAITNAKPWSALALILQKRRSRLKADVGTRYPAHTARCQLYRL